ncbi:unnamed protein product [Polarella glacialis]|nr:unnamed protein product [Polarella glacialis]
MAQQLVALRAEHVQVQAEKQSLRSSVFSGETTVAELECTLRKLQMDGEQLKADHQTSQHAGSLFGAQVAELEQKLATLCAERDQLQVDKECFRSGSSVSEARVAELEDALRKVRGESQQLQSEHELSRSQCVLAEQGTSELERRLRDLHAEHHQLLQLELEAQQELEANLRRGLHEVHEHRLSEQNCAAEQQAALGLREQLQQLEGEQEQLQTRFRDSVSKFQAEHRQLEELVQQNEGVGPSFSFVLAAVGR